MNVVDPSLPNGDATVDLGSGHLVSMKTVQQIYSEITGRTETLERSYKTNHSVGFDDLRQLNAKIVQLHEQYNIVSKSCAATLFHLDDQKQTFSSFERFELFDRSTLSPVENLRLEYNFLIVLPQMRKPQSYQIEINIHSRAALIKRANGDTSMRNVMFYEFFSPNTAHIEIEFVDYTVARNFQGVIDGWFKALPELETSWLLTPLKKLTGYYIFVFRMLSVAIYLTTCYQHFVGTLKTAIQQPEALFSASVITFGGMFLISIMAGKLGSITAESIKRVQCKSYINLTRGDELALSQMGASNRIAWFKASASILLAIGVNVVSTWLAARFGIGTGT